MLAIEYVNNTSIVKQMPRMTAINSCIEVDLTGQICSDSIGTRFYSGFGGQVDFIRGAAEGLDGEGVPIIAMPSTTKKGESKIAPTLKLGKFRIENGKYNFINIVKSLFRRWRRYLSCPCPLCCHRARYCFAVRQEHTPTYVRAHPDRRSQAPRGAGKGSV